MRRGMGQSRALSWLGKAPLNGFLGTRQQNLEPTYLRWMHGMDERWLDFDRLKTQSAHTAQPEIATISDGKLETAAAADPARHPMGNHLLEYVQPKIHHLVRDQEWRLIMVVGKHDRAAPYIISDNERRDKPFKQYRPTARVIDADTLEIACFPGRSYVQHNAMLIATYLSLSKQSHGFVQYETNPAVTHSLDIFSSDLAGIGHIDMVIVGYVDHLESLLVNEWRHGSEERDRVLSWSKFTAKDGRVIALLGCMVSFWGDISVKLIEALKDHGMTTFLYVGKAATVSPDQRPNQTIATGHLSAAFSDNGDAAFDISWSNMFKEDLAKSPLLVEGTHATISSPLLLSPEWVQSRAARRTAWVDCEVGLMAQACQGLSLSFSYLHIVSDNISGRNEIYGLWNERTPEVIAYRSVLFSEIAGILKGHLGSTATSSNNY